MRKARNMGSASWWSSPGRRGLQLRSCPSVWLTVYGYDEDYSTGAVENRSYHPVSARDARYFAKGDAGGGLVAIGDTAAMLVFGMYCMYGTYIQYIHEPPE